MSLITPYYEDQIKTLHERRSIKQRKWGSTSARNFGDEVEKFLKSKVRVKSLLDFGSGQSSMKQHLEQHLPKKQLDMLEIVEYDPGVPGKDILPDRNFEMIISSDVLEHVEPECIDETISWMQAHTTRFLYHHIACDPAGITLPDGRNVHLITEDLHWWMEKFTHPDWQWMYAADCYQQKRGYFRRHCHIRLDKVPGAQPIKLVPHE